MDFTLNNYINKPFFKRFNTSNILKDSLDWLVPKTCLSCDAPLQTLQPCCADCYKRLPFQHNYCSQCGQSYALDSDYCGRCISKPAHYDHCFCPFEYSGPISDLICKFKYQQRPELAKPIAQLLATEIMANELALPELLVPVPMHISRLRTRGFNQSILLARQLGRILKVPVAASVIRKHRKTAPQAQQTLKQRQRNVLGSFNMRKVVSANHVAIVDDVLTTGATANEIAKTLKGNGVNYCSAWGIAHTLAR